MPAVADVIEVKSIEAVQEVVRSAPHVSVRSGGSKTALSGPRGATTQIDVRGLSGILEYEPSEFVFTALAGTPVKAIAKELASHGQYMPFDPPLLEQGATLGGTVAAGLSGSGRQRYGGVRDFLIGARFVDGQGRLVKSGGKVVKNAAGFDQHKLLIGSLGTLGVLVELSFKVFPQPTQFATLSVETKSLSAALELLSKLAFSKYDMYGLDITFDDPAAPIVLVRLGGLEQVMAERMAGLRGLLGGGTVLDQKADRAAWLRASAFGWSAPGLALVKVPVTVERLAALDAVVEAAGARRRYVASGNLAWIGWPGDLAALDSELQTLGLPGVVVLGRTEKVLLGVRTGQALAAHVKRTLDPNSKFPELI